MALDTLEFQAFAEGGVPVSILAAVHTDLPVAVGHAVALAAQARGLIIRNFRTVVIQVYVAVLGIVTVQAMTLQAVFHHEIRMFVRERIELRVVAIPVVTHGTLVDVAVSVQPQGTGLAPDRRGIEDAGGHVADIQRFIFYITRCTAKCEKREK